MDSGDFASLLPLWIISIAGIWFSFPVCIYLFRPNAIRSYFKDNDSARIMEQKGVRDLIKKLKSMNFEYLGIKVEEPPLWKRSQEEVSLKSVESLAFASIGIKNRTIRFYFLTPFKEGKIVLTANSSFTEADNDEIIQSSLDRNEPKEILEIHKKHVTSFVNRGFTPCEEYTQQSRINAANLYYNSRLSRRQLRIAGAINFAFVLVFCFFLILPLLK
jgi:hypothetical protein